MAICDISWPTIRAMIYAFNDKQTLEEYIKMCFNILVGKASNADLPKFNKTIIHICLSHVMKCFSFHSKKYFKSRSTRRFIMYACSVLVNTVSLVEFKMAIRHFFLLLSSKHDSDLTQKAKNWIDEKAEQLGKESLLDEESHNNTEEKNIPRNIMKNEARIKMNIFLSFPQIDDSRGIYFFTFQMEKFASLLINFHSVFSLQTNI